MQFPSRPSPSRRALEELSSPQDGRTQEIYIRVLVVSFTEPSNARLNTDHITSLELTSSFLSLSAEFLSCSILLQSAFASSRINKRVSCAVRRR